MNGREVRRSGNQLQERENSTDYLGFIQSVITRMGQNSFQLKSWCITIIAALAAIMFNTPQNGLQRSAYVVGMVGILLTVLFCLLDSYYLYLERGYRRLYSIAAGLVDSRTCKLYDMAIPRECRGLGEYASAVFSVSTGLFYLTIIIAMVVIIVFVW